MLIFLTKRRAHTNFSTPRRKTGSGVCCSGVSELRPVNAESQTQVVSYKDLWYIHYIVRKKKTMRSLRSFYLSSGDVSESA